MKYLKITSASNPVIKDTIRIKKKTSGYEAFLIEGGHLIEMALASPGVEIKRVFFTERFASGKENQPALRNMAKKTAHLIETSEQIMSRLSDTEMSQGIAAVVSYRQFDIEEIKFKGVPFLIICDGIQDPGNLGTIIRAADAAGVDAVINLPGTCNIFNLKAVRATAGSLFNIPVVTLETDAILNYLGKNRIKLCVADVRAETSLYETDLRQPVAIAFGNEAQGASETLLRKADLSVKIPIIGKAESLNVASAASICIYEALRQRSYS